MGALRFTISETNPNEAVGGAGCLCSELRNEDARGPYAVFTGGTEMDNNLSPHPVLCIGCARHFVQQADDGAEALALGERSPVEAALEPAVEARQEQKESPTVSEHEIVSVMNTPDEDDEELTL